MPDTKTEAPSFDALLTESRQKRRAEQLAQEIFGKNKRPTTKSPASATRTKPTLGASLASRVGVAKRPSSLPRTNSANTRNGRSALHTRPSLQANAINEAALLQPTFDIPSEPRAAYEPYEAVAMAAVPELNIRGAAGGPHTVVAQNFAPGTTAADIESVMIDVGGQITDCHLIATHPTVVAEMTFVEKSGAETVIQTFNNKKADGRTLHVYLKAATAKANTSAQYSRAAVPAPEEPVVADVAGETMEVDENAEARETANRAREERRGRPDRGPRGARPDFQPRARGDRDNGYYQGARNAEPAYQDGRYGFDNRGRYRDDGRLYSDNGRRGGGGQNWRP